MRLERCFSVHTVCSELLNHSMDNLLREEDKERIARVQKTTFGHVSSQQEPSAGALRLLPAHTNTPAPSLLSSSA